MNILDLKYVSPAGTIEETSAEILIEIPIIQRQDAIDFVNKIKMIFSTCPDCNKFHQIILGDKNNNVVSCVCKCHGDQ